MRIPDIGYAGQTGPKGTYAIKCDICGGEIKPDDDSEAYEAEHGCISIMAYTGSSPDELRKCWREVCLSCVKEAGVVVSQWVEKKKSSAV